MIAALYIYIILLASSYPIDGSYQIQQTDLFTPTSFEIAKAIHERNCMMERYKMCLYVIRHGKI
jgi:hypothetical protein